MHNWVHKADLQPEAGQSPDHVAVDETVIQLIGQQYWLYAPVDPETNELLHTQLESTTTTVLAQSFLATVREKHDVDDVLRNLWFLMVERDVQRLVNAVFLVDGATSLQTACSRHGLDFRYEKRGNRNSVERVFREVKRRNSSLVIFLAMPKQKPPTTGSDHSPSHGISLSEHDPRVLHKVYLVQDGRSICPTDLHYLYYNTGPMNNTIELVEQYDIDREVIEALLLRYGDVSFDDTTKDKLENEEKVVYQFLESDGDHPTRLAEDHYYQFERSDVADNSSAPSSEAEFKEVLETLVIKGVVARTDEKLPRYSTSFYELLAGIKRDFTASEIDSLCESTNMSKRQVYYHILTDLHLNVDLTA